MDIRELRVGNYVKDPKNCGYTIRLELDDLHFAHLFQPAPLYGGFFEKNGIGKECIGEETHYFVSNEDMSIAATKEEELWSVRVINFRKNMSFTGRIGAIHEFQNILSDCGLYMKLLS